MKRKPPKVKWKPVDDVTAARIRKLAREGKIGMAKRDCVRAVEGAVQIFLADIGFPGALVTDQSRVSDFPGHEADRRLVWRAAVKAFLAQHGSDV